MQSPLPTGTLIQNRYRIDRVLGQGGFGRTYLVQDTNRFDECCVLKEFAPQDQGAASLQKAKDLFTREAGVLYQLRHPQIPRFRELFQVHRAGEDLIFLAQDYIEGETYETLLDDRKRGGFSFSEAEILKLLHQILPVLTYIHSAGIVHRDIAPDNIIFRSQDQQPVLIDFGVVKAIANRLSQPVASQTLVGKPGYASPEQLHSGKANPSSDLFSLAVTCIVLLTGREPKDLFDPVALTWTWQHYVSVSPRFAAVINNLLSYKPSDRYQSASDVLQMLEPINLSQPSIVQPPPPSVTQQNTIALVGRRRQSTIVHTNHSKGDFNSFGIVNILRFPLWILSSTTYVTGAILKGVFGAIKFTLSGVFKLIYRGAILAIVLTILVWAVPRLLDLVPQLADSLDSSNPKTKIPPELRHGDYLEQRCQELGLDYREFVRSVNEKFYTRYPDRRGKLLSDNQQDKALREEWYAIAQELLEKSGKPSDRNSLKEVAETQ
ncbi:MAG: serine/threonine protein kinase [Leptolyngbyaceae cyanobacterium CSU_1_3]|nr:serine/threonine protein kinase [Leptolyngbyaceae cyanobacterium CSU_1_3]